MSTLRPVTMRAIGPFGGEAAGEDRGGADGGGAFGDEAVLAVEGLHGAVDLGLADEEDVVEQRAAEREGQAVVGAEAAAERVGEALDLLDLDRAAGGEGGVHGGAAVHRDADDAGGGVGGLHRERDAGGEAAAGERHEDGGEVGAVLHDLEAGGALAGDDVRVVEGGDLGEAFGLRRGGGSRRRRRPGCGRRCGPRRRGRGWRRPWWRGRARTCRRRRGGRGRGRRRRAARPWLPVEQQVTPAVSGGQAGDGVERRRGA